MIDRIVIKINIKVEKKKRKKKEKLYVPGTGRLIYTGIYGEMEKNTWVFVTQNLLEVYVYILNRQNK